MVELYIPEAESKDKLTEEQRLEAKKKELEAKHKAVTDNMLDSSPTRSDAKTPPKAIQLPKENVNSAQKSKTPIEMRKEQIAELRQNAMAHIEDQRSKMDAIMASSDEKIAKLLEKPGEEAQKAYKGRQSARDEKLSKLGRRGNVTGLGLLGAAVDGLFTYSAERQEDPSGSKMVDLAKAGAVAGAWLVAEPIMWAFTLGGMAKGAAGVWVDDAQEAYDIKRSAALHVNKDESGSNKGTLGGTMVDNEYAATSRQRQEQIMRNHKISTESILGSEARQLHR